ncbi:MAG: phosphoglycerate dehydrogenase [Candidatus Latescibacterota bacterium]|jgi:phosphoglycerate dehydrogenase-like enzyme
MAAFRVLVSVPIDFRGRAPARDLLTSAGLEVVYPADRPAGTAEERRDRLADIDAILAGMEPLNGDTLCRAERLRVIARNGVGYDAVDVAYCTGRGIVVTNTPGALSDAVAEETFGLILALTRHLCDGDRAVKAGQYDVPYGEDLAVLTLGVVGGGQIGSEVVRRALAFKMRVLVHDPFVDPGRIRALGAEPVSLDDLLASAEIVTLHLPLTPQSRHVVDAGFLARMKPGSLLVNTARGGIVDEEALIAALQSGHLAGAGLDVQAAEPATGRSLDLVQLPNVVAMPHAGSKTWATRERMSVWAARSIVDLLQGRTPEHVVNREVLAGLEGLP